MALLETKRYLPKSPLLKTLIKYFWVFETQGPVNLNHKILPVTNIDLIFNFLSPTSYEKRGVVYETPGDAYFSGIRSDPILMKQWGPVLTIGVAFFPAGFYPFFNIPVTEFKNITVGLDQALNGPAADIEAKLHETEGVSAKIRMLEGFFLDLLKNNTIPSKDDFLLLHRFWLEDMGVRPFCSHYGVHVRTLERMFNKYVGTTPKGFLRLNRFQTALNRLLNSGHENLTELTHDFNFYDQPHFIREFKAFTGSSPTRFMKEKLAVMQITKIV